MLEELNDMKKKINSLIISSLSLQYPQLPRSKDC